MSMDAKCAHASVSDEVAELILDFFLYSATKTLLLATREPFNMSKDSAARAEMLRGLQLSSGFLHIYGSSHSQKLLDPALQLRARLLEFTAGFVLHNSCEFPFKSARDHIPRNVSRGIFAAVKNLNKKLRLLQESQPRVAEASPETLAHLLPQFMALSAHHLSFQGVEHQITDTWMNLAADFMVMAVIEQTLHQVKQSVPLNGIFNWGYREDNFPLGDMDDFNINAMFVDMDTESTNSRWLDIRAHHLQLLQPPTGLTIEDHANNLLKHDPSIIEFTNALLTFLESLHGGLEKPLLAQMESGTFTGFFDNLE